MASRVMCRQLNSFWGTGNYSYTRIIRSQTKVLRKIIGSNCRLPYCTSSSSNSGEVEVRFQHGLPVVTMLLPSRRERTQFTLKPITHSVGDFLNFIQDEDRGVDRVAVYNADGMKIAKSTPIDALLRHDFKLVLNDETHHVSAPAMELTSSEHMTDFSEVKNKISDLYTCLNVEQYQVQREQELLGQLEELRTHLQPFEKLKMQLENKAEKRTRVMAWLGLGMMGFQFGVLARLTWWEYSWDIMEPVTYFVTYGTTIAMFAYYVCTRQEYNFGEVRDREFLLTFHRHAKKHSLDLSKYNQLRDSIAQTEYDLQRLRDPLQMQLPIQHLLPGHLSKFPHPLLKSK